MKSEEDPWYSFKCACCSFAANYVVGILHPLELLKTRLQSHDGKTYDNIVPKYSNILQGLRKIHHQEGVSGLYKGIHFTMLSQASASALFFAIYEKRKLEYQRRATSTIDSATYAGIEASIISTLLTQPMWVVKTRLLLNTAPQGELRNAISKTKQIWRQGGLLGFYSGLSMNLVLCCNGALQMYSFEASKQLYHYLELAETEWGEINFVCGGLSKIYTTLVTYPFTTVRTRIQQDQYFDNRPEAKYKGIGEISRKIVREEGVLGFYKGLSPNLLRGIPQRAIYFYFYELFKQLTINAPV